MGAEVESVLWRVLVPLVAMIAVRAGERFNW